MSTVKASVDFTRHSPADLGEALGVVHAQMSANAATFPAPPMSMAELGALVEDYNAKLAARASRASADVLALRLARETVLSALRLLGNYANNVAQGDGGIVAQSGFPSYSTARPPDLSPPAAPENLRLLHGTLSGTIIARYDAQRQPSMNEVQVNAGNPNTEEDWRTAGMFQGQRVLLTGLTPGTRIWVRVRTAGLRGVMGNWSDPAEIMVI